MSTGVVDISSKTEALKSRKKDVALLEKQVEGLMRTWAPDEVPARQGCFPKLSLCPSWAARRNRVSTNDAAAPTTSTASELRQSGQGSKLLMRMVGVRKDQSNETEKLEVAMHTVQARVQSLTDRVKIGRERALTAKQEGRNEDAVRELKKAKAVEKQLNAARLALDTLERQQDVLAESTLHRELATALKSTTAGVKAKNKGLLAMAESAVDESVEIRDDVEDIAAVFENMAPAYDTGADEDELLAELESMITDTTALNTVEPESRTSTKDTGEELKADSFPSVPGSSASSGKSPRVQEKKALLKHDSAATSAL